MRSNVYHRNGNADGAGKRRDSDESPWLDDITTLAYRRPNTRGGHPLPRLAHETRAPGASAQAVVQPVAQRREAPQPRAASARAAMWLPPVLLAQSGVQARSAMLNAEQTSQADSANVARRAASSRLRLWMVAALLSVPGLAFVARTTLPGLLGDTRDTFDTASESQPAAAVSAIQPPPTAASVAPPSPGDWIRPGTLRIDSQPRTRVFVDDVLIGNTPQWTISLVPGVHSLRLYDAEHGLEKRITLDVHTGEVIDRVERLDR